MVFRGNSCFKDFYHGFY